MLIFDLRTIGNKLYHIRKSEGVTQAEVAEAAGLSDRTYADIERGTVNMRVETILKICQVLHITPNDLFTENNHSFLPTEENIIQKLQVCNDKERTTALNLLSVYLNSLNRFQE